LAAPAYTNSRSRRPAAGDGRSATRAGLAKPKAPSVGTAKASTSGEFPRVSVTDSRLVEVGGIRTPNANTILPAYSAKEAARRSNLIDPERVVNEALKGLEQKAAAYSAKVAAAGPKGILNIAKKYAGVPYLWGGTTTKGMDCSGYTQRVFREAGIILPRTSRSQFAWASEHGKAVNGISNARPGDLVFYSTNGDPSGIHHVGIYAGGGKYWNAPYTGQVISLRGVGSPTYIRRVL
jgi:cell wall-associated NlpC family hydrolase